MKDNRKVINTDELEKISGGNYGYDNYKKYVQLVNKVFWAAAEHGYRTACCPECGWKLELVTSFANSDDYENRDAANGILWCHSCHAHRKAEDWVINRFN